jgi:hypothetical protein
MAASTPTTQFWRVIGGDGGERRDQHHALEADVENVGLLGEGPADRREQQRGGLQQHDAEEPEAEHLEQNVAHAGVPSVAGVCRGRGSVGGAGRRRRQVKPTTVAVM